MDMGTALVVVAGIGAWYSLRSQRIRSGEGLGRGWHRKGAEPTAQPGPRELELQKEVAELKDRIHVLERIATDGRSPKALAAEIESLRGE
ncbi:MAG: hypothetical protein KGZ65_11345 [Sphingomonadales bacterium]|nr:hypothetical protein [Sphingomonadales bacterium]